MDELFTTNVISINEVSDLQKAAPNLIMLAAPILFLLVILEFVISKITNKEYYQKNETMGSIAVGVGNIFIGTLLKGSLFFLFVWVYNNLPWRMSLNWWTLIPCYAIFDFFSYWTHHISHRLRFFWAAHVVHHSASHFNLTVSFRLSWAQYIKIIFILPVALLGFHPVIIFVTSQLAVLFQFWTHTEYIKKLHPAIEFIFATPSNHRVHHGSQPEYINKNYGATFIIWDRIFGTYQKEDEPVTYGITKEITRKSNPLYINFHEYYDIVRDWKSAKNWKTRMLILFGDPEKIEKYMSQNDKR
jgi:sterol desaturase/sphingolipid hydroxylase (fatty acid hydroxylase superfamily)